MLILWDIPRFEKLLRDQGDNLEEVIPRPDGLAFVIDASDVDRFDEVKSQLRVLMNHPFVSGVPVLLYANKQDENGALTGENVERMLQLHLEIIDRKWEVQRATATKGYGLYKGIEWLWGAMSDAKVSRRNSFASRR